MGIEEAIRLVSNIQWKSVEKDNMEYSAKVSCYQLDAIEFLISYVLHGGKR